LENVDPAPIPHIQKDLSLVTGITIPGDDSHRWAVRSLLSLRLGWGERNPVQVEGNRTWLRQTATGSMQIK